MMFNLILGYWPWWLGAIALASVTVAYFLILGRSFGVSGNWASLVNWKEEQELQKAEEIFQDQDLLEMALLQATIEEFGEQISPEQISQLSNSIPTKAASKIPVRPTWSAHAIFLLMMTLGSLLAALTSHNFHLGFYLDKDFSSLVGNGWKAIVILLLGGVCIGFGTRLAGGCTSGHGLSGCSRLQPVSIVATAIFLVTAIVTSYLFIRII